MFRILGRRWLWGVLGAVATAMIVRRSQQGRGSMWSLDDNYRRQGRRVMQSVSKAGRAVVDAVSKR